MESIFDEFYFLMNAPPTIFAVLRFKFLFFCINFSLREESVKNFIVVAPGGRNFVKILMEHRKLGMVK